MGTVSRSRRTRRTKVRKPDLRTTRMGLTGVRYCGREKFLERHRTDISAFQYYTCYKLTQLTLWTRCYAKTLSLSSLKNLDATLAHRRSMTEFKLYAVRFKSYETKRKHRAIACTVHTVEDRTGKRSKERPTRSSDQLP